MVHSSVAGALGMEEAAGALVVRAAWVIGTLTSGHCE